MIQSLLNNTPGNPQATYFFKVKSTLAIAIMFVEVTWVASIKAAT